MVVSSDDFDNINDYIQSLSKSVKNNNTSLIAALERSSAELLSLKTSVIQLEGAIKGNLGKLKLEDSTKDIKNIKEILANVKSSLGGTNVQTSFKDINKMKELVKAIKVSNERLLALMQKSLDKIKVPEDESPAVKTRIAFDKEDRIALKTIIKRLDSQLDQERKRLALELKRKESEDEKKSKSSIKDQFESTRRKQLEFKFFGLFEGLVNGLNSLRKNLMHDFLPLMFALFGKSVVGWGRNLFTALKLPGAIDFITKLPKTLADAFKNPSFLQQWTKAGSLLAKTFGAFGKKLKDIWGGTKVGQGFSKAGTAIKDGISFAKEFSSDLSLNTKLGFLMTMDDFRKWSSALLLSTKIGFLTTINDFVRNAKKVGIDIKGGVDLISKTFGAFGKNVRNSLLLTKIGFLKTANDFFKQSSFLLLNTKLGFLMTIDDFARNAKKAGTAIKGGVNLISKTFGAFTSTLRHAGKILTTVSGASKLVGALKPFSKTVLKRLPVIGSIFSFLSAFQRFNSGDKIGGTIDILSGIFNLVPFAGPFIAIALDLVNLARDGAFEKLGDWLEGKTGENFITRSLKSKNGNSNSGKGDSANTQGNFGKNLARAAESLYGNTYKSGHMCLKGVQTSLGKTIGRKNAESIFLGFNANSAPERLNTPLAKKYFTKVGDISGTNLKKADYKAFPPGTIFTWPPNRFSKYGHIEIYDGLGSLISDYKRHKSKGDPYGINNASYKGGIYVPNDTVGGVIGKYNQVKDDAAPTALKTSSAADVGSDASSLDASIEEAEPQTISQLFESAMQELEDLQTFISGGTTGGSTKSQNTSQPDTSSGQISLPASKSTMTPLAKSGALPTLPSAPISQSGTINIVGGNSPAPVIDNSSLIYNQMPLS